MELSGKIVLITGGAVRLGRAISLEMTKAGAKLFCHYNSSEKQALSLKEQVLNAGGHLSLIKQDLTRKDAAKKIVGGCIDTFGGIDILINNAALFIKTPVGSVDEEEWELLHSVNLKSAFFLAQEASRHLLKQKSGKIINIGDAGAVAPFPAYIPYSITKAGIISLTQGLAKALAPHIQVNCINPGPVMMPEAMTASEKEFALEQTLLKREGNAVDIAKTVRFIIEGSDYITGAVIPVDGGRQIR